MTSLNETALSILAEALPSRARRRQAQESKKESMPGGRRDEESRRRTPNGAG
jgi:hypothetical protein